MDDREYEQFVADVVRGMSFSDKAKVFTNRHYPGVRQPGIYEIDVSREVWIDDALFFLIIVECKNWTRPIDRPQIQKLIQTRDAISAHKAAFASPVGYSKEAVEVAKANGVALWVVAEGTFATAAGGGTDALSICFDISNYLRRIIYESINYKFQYRINLLDGHPTLIPFSWLPDDTAISLSSYPSYRAVDPYVTSYDPIVTQLILHTLAAAPETNTLTQVLHGAIARIRQVLHEAGLETHKAESFLTDFAIKMVTEGISIAQLFERLDAFDRSISNAPTRLKAVFGLHNESVWENATRLFSKIEKSPHAPQ